MATYRITTGTVAGAYEVYFSGKPSEAVREALKGLKMRWNHKKACWYGFNDEKAILSAIQGVEDAPVRTSGYLGGGAVYGGKSRKGGNTLENIRADFKAAGLKGVTARKEHSGYTPCYTFTIKATPEDIIPREDFLSTYEPTFRYGDLYLGNGKRLNIHDFNLMNAEEQKAAMAQAAEAAYDKVARDLDNYGNGMSLGHRAPTEHPEFTEEFNEKIHKVYQIVNAYHWDESNAMVDYSSTNFYYDVKAKGKAVEA